MEKHFCDSCFFDYDPIGIGTDYVAADRQYHGSYMGWGNR